MYLGSTVPLFFFGCPGLMACRLCYGRVGEETKELVTFAKLKCAVQSAVLRGIGARDAAWDFLSAEPCSSFAA